MEHQRLFTQGNNLPNRDRSLSGHRFSDAENAAKPQPVSAAAELRRTR
jgi:hypothetical protein